MTVSVNTHSNSSASASSSDMARSLFIRPSSSFSKYSSSDLSEIRRNLENGPDSVRVTCLKSLIVSLLNGEKELVESLLMTLIRFVLPLKDKLIKKLLLYLFENMKKTDSEGNLRQEFILVCNNWRNDLQHPNEYVRGATLRFLCHIREAELLEPLVSSIRTCLEHEHAYVRRNAIYAAFSIYKNVEFIMPDAPELIEALLTHESDTSCQRAAFHLLSESQPTRALNYFNLIADRITEMDPSIQLAVIELLGKVVGSASNSEEKYLKVLVNILKRSGSSAAKFESAAKLIELFGEKEEVVKAAVDVLIGLAGKEADNSVKLLILMKLQSEVLPEHPLIIQSAVLDLLRILTCSDPTVRRICLELVATGTTSHVAPEIVQFLRKEVTKTSTSADEQYRKDLLDALHKCSMKFSEVATDVMVSYLELLKNGHGSETLVSFIKEALFKYPKLRQIYLSSVISVLPSLSDSKSVRSLLWLLGEFCVDVQSILSAIQSIGNCLGELPMLSVEERYEREQQQNLNSDSDSKDKKDSSVSSSNNNNNSNRVKILEDGTYASESAFDSSNSQPSDQQQRQLPNLKKIFLEGKFECSSVLANSLVKLLIRLRSLSTFPTDKFVALRCRVLLMLTSILRLGGSKYPKFPIDQDSVERIALSIQMIMMAATDSSGNTPVIPVQKSLEKAFTIDSEAAFNSLQSSSATEIKKLNCTAVDEPIDFSSLISTSNSKSKTNNSSSSSSSSSSSVVNVNSLELVLSHSASSDASSSESRGATTEINRVIQLTGFSDPIYAETYVQMSGKEVLLDILLVNQTEDTLQNVSLDLLCVGDLKLVEKPAVLTLPPFSFASCKAIFRVTATNHGQIFGCISFLSGPTGLDADTVILAEIKIDVLEYIQVTPPRDCIDETDFRDAWVLLEWENKISIKLAQSGGLKPFLDYLCSRGHLTCITPNVEIGTSFLACNLYAKSIFNEEILANLSLEQNPTTNLITGHLRLRSKTQGLAVAFGDKLNLLIQQSNK